MQRDFFQEKMKGVLIMSKQMLEKLYGEYREKRAMASDDVRRTYDEMHDAFQNYLDAVCEDEFRNAFMFGYAYGLKAAQAGMKEGVCA